MSIKMEQAKERRRLLWELASNRDPRTTRRKLDFLRRYPFKHYLEERNYHSDNPVVDFHGAIVDKRLNDLVDLDMNPLSKLAIAFAHVGGYVIRHPVEIGRIFLYLEFGQTSHE